MNMNKGKTDRYLIRLRRYLSYYCFNKFMNDIDIRLVIIDRKRIITKILLELF